MAYYEYKGRDTRGRLKQGRIKAASKKEAEIHLKETGIMPRQVQELTSFLYKDLSIGSGVKNKDFVIYLRQFATLIDSGISLIEATYILSEQTSSKKLGQTLRSIALDLEAGQAFSFASDKHQKVFPSMFVNMVRAGEAGGNLDEILGRMADYYEKQHLTRQKVISALSYPMVVGAIALVIVIFMLSFVVPRFADMFVSFGSEIPLFTRMILQMGQFFGSFWWLFFLVPLALYFSYRYSRQFPAAVYRIDELKMRLPIFGTLIQKSALARMTRTLSSLFNSSVPILEAVQITERIVSNKVIEGVLQQTRLSLEKGESMAAPMINHWAFPSLVTQMIVVGEKTGALDQMLNKAADFYEQDIEQAADRIKTLIEPIMIVILAIIVGGIVCAIAIPMFAIFDKIQ